MFTGLVGILSGLHYSFRHVYPYDQDVLSPIEHTKYDQDVLSPTEHMKYDQDILSPTENMKYDQNVLSPLYLEWIN